jgi:hypothetical protein
MMPQRSRKTASAPSSLTVEEFTDAVLGSVATAIERRGLDRPAIRGPIIYGIIWWPELGPARTPQLPSRPAARGT